MRVTKSHDNHAFGAHAVSIASCSLNSMYPINEAVGVAYLSVISLLLDPVLDTPE